jgi:hypothetical protein
MSALRQLSGSRGQTRSGECYGVQDYVPSWPMIESKLTGKEAVLAPPPEIKVWLPWSELNKSPHLVIDEFRATLRAYPRSAILIACARLSTIFQFGPDANTVASQEINEYWVPRLMRPDLVDRAMKEVKNGRPIFFQGQLRFLAAEAMRLDPALAEDGSQVPDWALGALLLGAGELL